VSALARRGRDRQFERDRAIVEMRGRVLALVGGKHGRAYFAGSSAVEEAVGAALIELTESGKLHAGDVDDVFWLWIDVARKRLFDHYRSAEERHRALSTVHDLDGVLGSDIDMGGLSEQTRRSWRVKEMLSVLRGDERRWAEVYYDAILDLEPGAQPRGLHKELAWTPDETENVAKRARRRMLKLVKQRAAGVICTQRRSRLDAFIAQAREGRAIAEIRTAEGYDDVLVHIAGCEECWLAWHERRRVFAPVILAFPAQILAGWWQALSDKFGGVGARVGIGGATAGGGAAATIGAKTAVCVGVACVAAVGTTAELTGVLPPLKPDREIATVKRKPTRGPQRPAATRAPTVQRAAQTPPPPVTVRRTSTSSRPATSTSSSKASSSRAKASPPPPPPPVARTSSYTPGDLPVGGSPPPATAPPPPAASPSCVPGDLAC
jgi:hypothetical protein